jgi:hypothetical protein
MSYLSEFIKKCDDGDAGPHIQTNVTAVVVVEVVVVVVVVAGRGATAEVHSSQEMTGSAMRKKESCADLILRRRHLPSFKSASNTWVVSEHLTPLFGETECSANKYKIENESSRNQGIAHPHLCARGECHLPVLSSGGVCKGEIHQFY